MSRPSKITADRRTHLIQAWQSGASQSELAAMFGVAKSTVHSIVRGVRQEKTRRLSSEDRGTIMQEFELGASVAELAVKYARTPRQIRNLVREVREHMAFRRRACFFH